LSIIDQNNQYEMVTVRGKVTEQITGESAEKHIDKLSKNISALINIQGGLKENKESN
jgi:hypothetical protein